MLTVIFNHTGDRRESCTAKRQKHIDHNLQNHPLNYLQHDGSITDPKGDSDYDPYYDSSEG